MVVGYLKPLITIVLLFLFCSTASASCRSLTREETEAALREDAANVFFKGLFLGVLLSAYIANFIWFGVTTGRWLIGVLLSVLTVPPFLIVAFYAEVITGECGFGGGLDSKYYLVPVAILVVLFLVQVFLDRSSGSEISIRPN